MTIVEGVGWVLLHFVWQGALIAVVLAILLAVIGDGQARLRYALAAGALTLMLAVTVMTAARLMRGGEGAAPARQAGRVATTALLSGRVARDQPGHDASRTLAAPPHPRDTHPAAQPTGPATPLLARALPWLVSGWLLGVLLLSLRLLGGWWTGRALRVADVSPVPEWCQAQLRTLAARMRIARPVAIVSSIRISVPIVLGHIKPVIVLPAAALSGLSARQVEAILAHELAHVRRHDYLVNLAQAVIETLLFYHPAVWWVSRQVRETREHCCDDLAVAVCRSRREYVHALLELEELREAAPALALAATGGSLLARGRRLLAPAHGQGSSPHLAASVVGLLVLAAAVTGASVSPASVPMLTKPQSATALAPALANTAAVGTQTQGPPTPVSPVMTSPDTTGPLASRWAWAVGAARSAGRRTYWIGYSVSPVKTLPPFVYSDRATEVSGAGIKFSGHVLSSDTDGLRFAGRRLGVDAAANGPVKLLFALDASRGEPVLTRVHLSTLAIPADTRDFPVYWLGRADAAASLERIDRFYSTVSSADLKQDLVYAAAVHDASPAVVAWLERRIASKDPDEVRGDAAEGISWHPITASIAVLERTARQDRSSRVRQEAAEALGDLDMPEAAPVLIALAQSLTDPDARREAVEALGARRESQASDALASIARHDSNIDIQREAVETLGDFQDKRGVGPLTELARTHPDVDVRREAIETLGDILPPDSAATTLKQFLTDGNPRVREEAVDTIAGIEHASGLSTLLELARSDSSVEVRVQAVEALGDAAGRGESHAADRAAIVELLSTVAASDRDPDLQIEAAETLGEIGGPAAVAQLRKLATTHADEDLRVKAVESLGHSDAPAAETAEFLKSVAIADKSPEVQTKALETLSELADSAGIRALVDLARSHPSETARREALQRLLDSDHPDARALFERALKKSPDR